MVKGRRPLAIVPLLFYPSVHAPASPPIRATLFLALERQGRRSGGTRNGRHSPGIRPPDDLPRSSGRSYEIARLLPRS
jgi:hypothetical protein